VDDLLLTRESTDQMADLAGNAMTSTIVGTCILTALLLGKEYLYAFDLAVPEPGAVAGTSGVASMKKSGGGSSARDGARGASPVRKQRKSTEAGPSDETLSSPALPRSPAGGLITSNGVSGTAPRVSEATGAHALRSEPLELAAISAISLDLDALLAQAGASRRMCVSEGRDGLASDILQCVACGGTVSRKCTGWPEHKCLEPLRTARLAPTTFETTLKGVLPMCVELSGLADVAALEALKPDTALIGPAPNADAPTTSSAPAAARVDKDAEEAAALKTALAAAEASGASLEVSSKGKGAASAANATPSPIAPAKPAMKQVGMMAFFKPKAAAAAVEAPLELPKADESMAPKDEDEAMAAPASKKATRDEGAADESNVLAASKRSKASGGTPATPLSEEEQLWNAWAESLRKLGSTRFYFESVTRAERWTATYADDL